MSRTLKIAYVTAYTGADVSAWSGLSYYISQTLQKHVGDVTHIQCHPRALPGDIVKRMYARLVEGASYYADRSEASGRLYASQIEKAIRGRHFDIIFSPGTIPIAYLETNIPKVFWTDATWRSMIGYYFKDVCSFSKTDGDRMEKAALDGTKVCIYSSLWAAHSAIADYSASPDKVAVIPFGANLARVPSLEYKQKNDKILKLLFVGRDWVRKGGDIALSITRLLKEAGVNAKLVIVGCQPPLESNETKLVEFIGYLDKRKQDEEKRLLQLYNEADFFILPSRQEAFGVVFSEASAFALPLIGSYTGAIPNVIEHDQNGILIHPDDDLVPIARRVLEIWRDQNEYTRMSRNARRKFEQQLNWESAGKKVREILLSAV